MAFGGESAVDVDVEPLARRVADLLEGSEPVFAEEDEANSGANAEARREEILLADQVAVMLSGKRDGSSTAKTSDSFRSPSWTALFWSSFWRTGPRPSASPVEVIRVSYFSFYFFISPQLHRIVRTCAQAENLHMVPQLRLRQGQQRRRKEHGLIVGVGDQEAYPLVIQRRESAAK